MARIRIATNISFDDVRKMYYVTFNYGNGVKTTKTYKTKKQAEIELKKFEVEKAQGNLIKHSKKTFESWASYWLDNICAPYAEETTIYGYRNIINKHLIPSIGTNELQRITASDIRSYYENKLCGTDAVKPLSPNTIRKHHDLLRMIFDAAVQDEHIVKSPMTYVKPPKTIDVEHKVYTQQELLELFNFARGDRLEIVIKLAGYYGMRREEICGLMWKDVDFENNVISINRAMTMAGGKVIIKPPKTKGSKRKEFMVDDIRSLLLEIKKEQDGYRKLLGDQYMDIGFVLQWPDGKPYRPNYISELFTKFLKDNKLKVIKLHELRHTFASIANDIGVSLFDISKALGHGNTSTTGKIYTHLFDNTNKKAVDRVAEAIQNMKTE